MLYPPALQHQALTLQHQALTLPHPAPSQLLLVPQLDTSGKPLLLGYFFPVRVHMHRQGSIVVQPKQLLGHLEKQDRLRGRRAQLSAWEQQWEAQRLRPRLAIPYSEPKVSSQALLWSLVPGPLQYVTTNVVVGRGKEPYMESLGFSEADFCAPCDCLIGPGGCGGAE